MSNPTTPRRGTYSEEAAAQDSFLDEKLASIRAAEANGHITNREAADMRVAALEHHIQAVRFLRQEHFGGSDTPAS